MAFSVLDPNYFLNLLLDDDFSVPIRLLIVGMAFTSTGSLSKELHDKILEQNL